MPTLMQREIIVRKGITSKMRRYDDMEKQSVDGGIPEDAVRYLAYSNKFKIGGNK